MTVQVVILILKPATVGTHHEDNPIHQEVDLVAYGSGITIILSGDDSGGASSAGPPAFHFFVIRPPCTSTGRGGQLLDIYKRCCYTIT